MSKPIIDTDECTGCGICIDTCPNDVLELIDDVSTVVNEEACTGCGACAEECPMEAIKIEES